MGAFAVLKKDNPFYSIFPAGWVPIFPISPERLALAGEASPMYVLRLRDCTDNQLQQLAEAVAKTRGGTVAEVRAFLEAERRLPLQISDVVRVDYLATRNEQQDASPQST